MKKLSLMLITLLTFFPIFNSLQADKKSSISENISFACPLTAENNLGEVIKAIEDEAQIDGLLTTYPKEFINATKDLKKGNKVITVSQLKPIMPYVLKRIIPQLLNDDQLNIEDYNDIIMRAQRIKDGCNQSISKDVTKPVTDKTSINLDSVIRILCLIQKDIDICCKKLCKKIDHCCDEIIDTITECCDGISSQTQEYYTNIDHKIDNCCDEISDLIEECYEELDSKLDDVQDQIDDCCDEILESITECCDGLEIKIDECCERLSNKIDDLSSIVQTILMSNSSEFNKTVR